MFVECLFILTIKPFQTLIKKKVDLEKLVLYVYPSSASY